MSALEQFTCHIQNPAYRRMAAYREYSSYKQTDSSICDHKPPVSRKSRDGPSARLVLELSVRWYTVVYILGVYIECLPRVS
jgi:hypothetical protein